MLRNAEPSSVIEQQAEGASAVDALIIKVAAVVVSVMFWLAMIWIFERGARKRSKTQDTADRIEAKEVALPTE